MLRGFILYCFFVASIALSAARPCQLILPDQTPIHITHWLTSPQERVRGLSGVLPQDFGPRDGAFFVFQQMGWRQFWMPETHFDLDIIFLDRHLTIIDIARNIAHHPSKKAPIPRIAPRWAHHVLEVKAQTPGAKKLKPGLRLRLKGKPCLEQIKSGTPPEQ